MTASGVDLTTRDRIAGRFGEETWELLISKLSRGAKVTKYLWGDEAKEDIAAFQSLRVEAGLVMVRQGVNFVIGLPSSFSADELSPDLLMEGTSGIFDDGLNPIGCPRWWQGQKRYVPMPLRQEMAYRFRLALPWGIAGALGAGAGYPIAYLAGASATEVLYKGSASSGLMFVLGLVAAFCLIQAPYLELPARPED